MGNRKGKQRHGRQKNLGLNTDKRGKMEKTVSFLEIHFEEEGAVANDDSSRTQ